MPISPKLSVICCSYCSFGTADNEANYLLSHFSIKNIYIATAHIHKTFYVILSYFHMHITILPQKNKEFTFLNILKYVEET